MKSVTYYTFGGSGAGAVIGAMYFLIDPLGPSADFRKSVLTGIGVGAIAGFILGVMQLNKQAVMPGRMFQDENEFLEGNNRMHDPTATAENQFAFHFPAENALRAQRTQRSRKEMDIPLLNFGFQF